MKDDNKTKPFKKVLDTKKCSDDQNKRKTKPFKVKTDKTLNIDEDITIDKEIDESFARLQSRSNFLSSFKGVFLAVFAFIVVAIIADTINSIENIIKSGSISEFIYLFGLLFLLFVLISNIYFSIKQFKLIKNIEHIKNGFKKQKHNPTKDIIPLTYALLQHFENISDSGLKEKIKIIKNNLNTSQIYKEIYNDIDTILLSDIDKKAKQMIQNASIQGALSTAISPYSLLDMALTAWRSMLLTKDIATLYGFRPGKIATILLLKQGIFNTVFAGIAELTTEMTNDMTSTSVVSKISKSAGQGIANGILLARLGYGAMKACRPLDFDKDLRSSFISSIIKSVIGSFGFKHGANQQR
ncbi:MAG: TIGR01620 family protein [Sulfurospirillum sp.]